MPRTPLSIARDPRHIRDPGMKKLTQPEFAAALLMHRERLGLSQPAAAKLCDVSHRAWWQWENAAGNTLAVTQEGVLARLKFAKVKK